jgi:hypothetical protein
MHEPKLKDRLLDVDVSLVIDRYVCLSKNSPQIPRDDASLIDMILQVWLLCSSPTSYRLEQRRNHCQNLEEIACL